MDKLLVGLKEMEELAAKHQNALEQSSPKEELDLDNVFIESSPKLQRTQLKANIPENPNKPVKKQPKAKRGISQLPDDELHERLAKMREKAAIVKKQKAEERRKQVGELKQLKLSQKLDIPVETLAEYETIRKSATKPVDCATKPTRDVVPPEPKLNVDDIVERLFQRINTAKQQEDVRKQEAERVQQQEQQIRKQQEVIKNQQNQAYFNQLGNGKIPKPAQQDKWMALFNRKK